MATSAQPSCSAYIIYDANRNQDIGHSYAGDAPGMVTGVVQINFAVGGPLAPTRAPPLPVNYYLKDSGKPSDQFFVYVAP